MSNIKFYNEYLSNLSDIERKAAPKELFFEGNKSLLTQGAKVSIVGSRKTSELAERRTNKIVRDLVARGVIIVSGLAQGIDTFAHKEAIYRGGKTIAVLGTPLDKCTPVSNQGLLIEIKRNHLAVSQFREGSQVYPSNFPSRNKTMALISYATIIIEASENSGTQHQAWEAIRLGRPLVLLENVACRKFEWTEKLLEYGAIVLNKANYNTILDELSEMYLEPLNYG